MQFLRQKRRVRLALWLGAGSLLASFSAMAQSPTPDENHRRIIEFERDKSEIMPNLEYLSDVIGARLTGSASMLQANRWTAEKMKEYGLQNVKLEPYTIPQGWERGRCEAQIIAPIKYKINVAQMAWTHGTHGKVKGEVVVFSPRTEADFEAFRGKLKNAIIVTPAAEENMARRGVLPGANPPPPIPAFAKSVTRNTDPALEKAMTGRELEDGEHSHDADEHAQPPTRRGGGAGAGGFQQMMEFRRKVNAFLAEEGAAATLRVSDKPHDLHNMTGSWSSISKIPTLFITQEHLALIHRLLKRNKSVTLEVEAKSKFIKGPVTVYNTVGEIPGTEKPKEVILLGAHLDSWDIAQGTTDNGTGSMIVLEVARIFKELNLKPKRTIRFALFSGEEQGLFGSRAYVEAHKAEMSNFNVVFVHDTGTGRVRGAWLQGRAETRPVLEQEFASAKALGLLTENATLSPGKMNGTDHASFDDAGVPAFAFMQDRAEYSLTHHSQTDTFDKARPDDLMQGACVMAIFAWNAATSAQTYPRK